MLWSKHCIIFFPNAIALLKHEIKGVVFSVQTFKSCWVSLPVKMFKVMQYEYICDTFFQVRVAAFSKRVWQKTLGSWKKNKTKPTKNHLVVCCTRFYAGATPLVPVRFLALAYDNGSLAQCVARSFSSCSWR